MSRLLTRDGLLVVRNNKLVTVVTGEAANCECCGGVCGFSGEPPAALQVDGCDIGLSFTNDQGPYSDYAAEIAEAPALPFNADICYAFWQLVGVNAPGNTRFLLIIAIYTSGSVRFEYHQTTSGHFLGSPEGFGDSSSTIDEWLDLDGLPTTCGTISYYP